MSKEVRLRRGDAATNDNYTGPAAEVTVDTTEWNLRLHDGVTIGGFKILPNDGTTYLYLEDLAANSGSIPEIDRTNIFSENQVFESAQPRLILNENDTVANVRYSFYASNGVGGFEKLDDTNGQLIDIMSFDQSGNVSMTQNLTVDGNITGTIAVSNVTELSNLTASEGAQLENIDNVTISNTQWGYLGNLDQDVDTASAVTFNGITTTANVDIGTNGIDFNDGTNKTITATELGYLDGVTRDLGDFDNLTSDEIAQLEKIDTNSISNTQWGYLAGLDQSLDTASGVTFNGITTTSRITLGTNPIDVDDSGTARTITVGELSKLDGVTRNLGDFNNLTTDEIAQVGNIDTVSISNTQWGYVGNLDQDLDTASAVTFSGITSTANVDIGTNGIDFNDGTAKTVTSANLAYLNNLDQDVDTASAVTFSGVTSTANVDIGTNGLDFNDGTAKTVTSTELGYLEALDQGVSTGDNVTFNEVLSGAPTGGSQGAGTINAEGVYDGGVRIANPSSNTDQSTLAFDTDRTPNSNRATMVQIEVQAETDGTTNGTIAFNAGGTTNSLVFCDVPSALGSGISLKNASSFLVPAGNAYRVSNISDPNTNNAINSIYEYTL